MSFSWMEYKNKNISKSSPTLHQVVINQISRAIKNSKSSMKRISLLAFCKQRRYVGSMTVEAAILLPLFLFFFLHLFGVVEMLRLHSKITFGLWECGNQLAVYVAMPEELGEKVPDVAVSYLYVKNRMESFLGREYLDTSPLVSGRQGLNYLASAYDEDCIDIGVTYQVAPQFSVFPFPYLRMVNRYYGKAWTGYLNNSDVRFVYVTIYGEVWHSRADCTHIFITIKETDWSNIGKLRNHNGGKYYPCELCEKKEKGNKTYYTEYGDRYHKDRECSSLVRYIRAIQRTDSIAYKPCSRCAENGGAK